MKTFILMVAASLVLLSCQGSKQQTKEITPEQIEAGHKWLQSLIINADQELCIDHADPEKVMTPRLFELFSDAWKIYGPSDMTEEEYLAAEQAYKKKWSGVYPLKEDEFKLFGTGNDMTVSICDLKITHKEGLTYNVYIRYEPDYAVSNDITLVPHEGSFLIDYASAEWIEYPVEEQKGVTPRYFRKGWSE